MRGAGDAFRSIHLQTSTMAQAHDNNQKQHGRTRAAVYFQHVNP